MLKIKQLRSNAVLPTRSHDLDAGLDVYSTIETIILPGERLKIPLGLAVEIPIGYLGLIQTKSGRAVNEGLDDLNSFFKLERSLRKDEDVDDSTLLPDTNEYFKIIKSFHEKRKE